MCDIPVLHDIVRNVSKMAFNEIFWILRKCLVLVKLVVKDSSTVKGITAQQFFSQMTKRNEQLWNFIKSLELHYNDYDHEIGSEEGDKVFVISPEASICAGPQLHW